MFASLLGLLALCFGGSCCGVFAPCFACLVSVACPLPGARFARLFCVFRFGCLSAVLGALCFCFLRRRGFCTRFGFSCFCSLCVLAEGFSRPFFCLLCFGACPLRRLLPMHISEFVHASRCLPRVTREIGHKKTRIKDDGDNDGADGDGGDYILQEAQKESSLPPLKPPKDCKKG